MLLVMALWNCTLRQELASRICYTICEEKRHFDEQMRNIQCIDELIVSPALATLCTSLPLFLYVLIISSLRVSVHVCVCKCVNDFTSSEQNQRNLACGSTSAITASSLCDMFSSQTDPEEKETQEGS